MRRNSNYFADVSKLFLKAKKQEAFDLNPEVKNQVRETLVSKIQLMKKKIMDEEIAETSAPKAAILMNFFKQWKNQLIGVPASLLALVMIVVAANNFHFSTNDSYKTSLLEPTVKETQQDSADFENADLAEEKPKPELLVLDINNIGTEQRTLNKTTIGQKTPETQPQQPTKVETPLAESVLNSSVTAPATPVTSTTQLTGGGDTTENSDSTQPEEDTVIIAENTQTDTKTTTASQSESVSELTTSDAQTVSKTTDTSGTESLDTIISDINSAIKATTEPIQTAAPTTTTAGSQIVETVAKPEIATSQISLSDQIAANNVLLQKTRTKEYIISYYGNSSYKETMTFDTNIITKLTAKSAAAEVNVYYIDSTHVIVEVKDATSKKLYSYEKVDDSWNAVKYEKL